MNTNIRTGLKEAEKEDKKTNNKILHSDLSAQKQKGSAGKGSIFE